MKRSMLLGLMLLISWYAQANELSLQYGTQFTGDPASPVESLKYQAAAFRFGHEDKPFGIFVIGGKFGSFHCELPSTFTADVNALSDCRQAGTYYTVIDPDVHFVGVGINGRAVKALGVEWSYIQESDVGLVYIDQTNHRMGTHQQFYLRLGFGFRYRSMSVIFAALHMSNGKSIFGWSGNNYGLNVFQISMIGYTF